MNTNMHGLVTGFNGYHNRKISWFKPFCIFNKTNGNLKVAQKATWRTEGNCPPAAYGWQQPEEATLLFDKFKAR